MSKHNITELFNNLKNENQIFLSYLKAKFPVFHNSNVFVKDFEYGLKGFLEKKGIYLSENNLAELSKLLSEYFVTQNVFVKTSTNAWKLNYPEFVTAKPGDPFSF